MHECSCSKLLFLKREHYFVGTPQIAETVSFLFLRANLCRVGNGLVMVTNLPMTTRAKKEGGPWQSCSLLWYTLYIFTEKPTRVVLKLLSSLVWKALKLHFSSIIIWSEERTLQMHSNGELIYTDFIRDKSIDLEYSIFHSAFAGMVHCPSQVWQFKRS